MRGSSHWFTVVCRPSFSKNIVPQILNLTREFVASLYHLLYDFDEEQPLNLFKRGIIYMDDFKLDKPTPYYLQFYFQLKK